MPHATETTGWEESKYLASLQTRYIKWNLGLYFNTSTQILLEETKVDKTRIKAVRRAVRYEERMEATELLIII